VTRTLDRSRVERRRAPTRCTTDLVAHIFAILSDFTDADQRDMPGDDAVLAAARAGIEALNERWSPHGESRFFLFHSRASVERTR